MESSSDQRRIALIVLAEGMITAASVASGARLFAGVVGWLAGLLAWTVVEYLLHRFLFHLPPQHPLARLGARMHYEHHDAPAQRPIVKPPALTLGAFALTLTLAATLAGLARVAPFWGGLVAGYLLYELSHVAIHALDEARHPWPAQRRRHLDHHADPHRSFGISSPLWDLVLGTGTDEPH